MAPFIRLQNVTKRFADVNAVNDLSLDIDQGELFCLLGASGCGKSTLLRMLAGFETPTSGRIEIDGQNMADVSPADRPVNMMFQSYALFPHMTVANNIAYGLRRAGMQGADLDARVDSLIKLVRLDGLASRKPHKLSGGQRQRVALARALARQPKLLLLDEPLAALDKKLREDTQFELVDIQEKLGTTFIVVTHDQEEAMALSDRIAILKDGQIEQIGTPNELYDKPASEFVANFFGKCALWPIIKSKKETEKSLLEHTNLPLKTAIMPDSNTARAVIRPEFLEIAEQQITSKNQLKAKVLDILTKGTSNLITVEFENGLLLDIDVPRKYVLPDLSEHVYIKLTQNELHIIND